MVNFAFCFQAFVASGTNLQLSFLSNAWSDRPEDRTPTREFVDFDREVGKVGNFLHLRLAGAIETGNGFTCIT